MFICLNKFCSSLIISISLEDKFHKAIFELQCTTLNVQPTLLVLNFLSIVLVLWIQCNIWNFNLEETNCQIDNKNVIHILSYKLYMIIFIILYCYIYQYMRDLFYKDIFCHLLTTALAVQLKSSMFSFLSIIQELLMQHNI